MQMTNSARLVAVILVASSSLMGCNTLFSERFGTNLGSVVQPFGPQPPSVPPATIVPPLDRIPPAQNYIAPGLEGIFANLRRDEAATGRLPGLNRPPKLQPPALWRHTRYTRYTRYTSPLTPADPKLFAIGQIIVKFVEGSIVRLRDSGLQVADSDRGRLSRLGVETGTVKADLVSFEKLVAEGGAKLGRVISDVDEADLDRLREYGQTRSGDELPDLNLFYFVHLDNPTPEQAMATLNAIKGLRSVESAYFQPLPFGAADIPPLTNIDVSGDQGYFGPAPSGIDATYARLFSGGRGNAVRIADIEAGWDDSHEDLPALNFRIGVNWAIDEKNGSHCAAVLGELVANENGFGANGLVPNAIVGWSSVTNFDPANIYFYSVANALLATGRVLQAGDIALIEQQFAFGGGFICNPAADPCGNCTLPTWVAVEEYPAEHAAISLATAAGIVVVEAAGNWRMRVTPASRQDSGAIVVGAGMTTLAPFSCNGYGTGGFSVSMSGPGGQFGESPGRTIVCQ